MKKLNKRNLENRNTLESYACACGCSCSTVGNKALASTAARYPARA